MYNVENIVRTTNISKCLLKILGLRHNREIALMMYNFSLTKLEYYVITQAFLHNKLPICKV